ncbi:MAG: hypothetical protein K9M07_02520 [Simkaniaceae bacterium]|nr:hypothetical protein [Simkaniaceae bacterium]
MAFPLSPDSPFEHIFIPLDAIDAFVPKMNTFNIASMLKDIKNSVLSANTYFKREMLLKHGGTFQGISEITATLDLDLPILKTLIEMLSEAAQKFAADGKIPDDHQWELFNAAAQKIDENAYSISRQSLINGLYLTLNTLAELPIIQSQIAYESIYSMVHALRPILFLEPHHPGLLILKNIESNLSSLLFPTQRKTAVKTLIISDLEILKRALESH